MWSGLVFDFLEWLSNQADSTDSLHSLAPSVPIVHRPSRLHPASAQSWCMNIFAGQPSLQRPCVSFYRRLSLMSSSQFPSRHKYVLFFKIGYIVWWERSSRSVCLCVSACSLLKTVCSFLCRVHHAFSSSISLECRWCIHTVVLTRPHLWWNTVSYYQRYKSAYDRNKWLAVHSVTMHIFI